MSDVEESGTVEGTLKAFKVLVDNLPPPSSLAPARCSAPEKSIEAVARGLVRKWLSESKATRYLTTHDEDQLVEICLHSYEIGKAQNE